MYAKYGGVTMIKGYKTITEMAEEWEVTTRWIQMLCKNGSIEGAELVGRTWVIPEGTKKPADAVCIVGWVC